MQLSIGKLAALSISLLIAVSLLTAGTGIYLLHAGSQSQEQHHRAVIQINRQPIVLDMSGYEKRPADSLVSPAGTATAQQPLETDPYAPGPTRAPSFNTYVLAGTLIIVIVSMLAVFLVIIMLGRFRSDMLRIQKALQDISAGRYQSDDVPTAIAEVGAMLPDIDQLALKMRQQREKLRHQSLSDPLTGVFNRRYFDLMLAHLHEQSQRQSPATLAVIDLNDFKIINDDYGHAEGDRVLQQMAAYLQSRIRATDIVVRLGGDAFALLLTHMGGDVLEDWLAALVHDHDHQMLENSGATAFCQFSIGVAPIDARLYPRPEDVFSAADGAMYAIKQRRQIHHSRFAIARPGNVTTLKPRRAAL